MTTLPVHQKIELALISYLWQFGGTIDSELLTDEAGLFDNPAFFTPNPIASARVLAAWPAGFAPFAGLTWYPGHCGIDMKAPYPRCIVTCPQAGGDGSYAGYDDCVVEVLLCSKGDDAVGQAQRHYAVCGRFGILGQLQLWAIQAAVNMPAEDDTRAVQGFGLDGLVFKDQIEGRDKETNVHGARFNFECTAHLE
jgi:hypothetical protein